ncbi:MAG: hypothetical protein ACON4Z_00125, partial [Planctomycetota bacterium]
LGGIMVWWDNVPNWPAVAGVTCSMSIEFTVDGSVVNIAYGTNLANDGGGNDAIIGFSGGNGEPVGAAIDWSAIPSLPGAAVSGDGSSAPDLGVTARPVEGTATDLVVGNLPAYTPGIPAIAFFALAVGSGPPGGIDLSLIGAPGCNFYPDATAPLLITGIEDLANNPGVISIPLSLPAGAAGNDVFAQAAVWNDLLPPNNANLTLSNGICLKVGSL